MSSHSPTSRSPGEQLRKHQLPHFQPNGNVEKSQKTLKIRSYLAPAVMVAIHHHGCVSQPNHTPETGKGSHSVPAYVLSTMLAHKASRVEAYSHHAQHQHCQPWVNSEMLQSHQDAFPWHCLGRVDALQLGMVSRGGTGAADRQQSP